MISKRQNEFAKTKQLKTVQQFRCQQSDTHLKFIVTTPDTPSH